MSAVRCVSYPELVAGIQHTSQADEWPGHGLSSDHDLAGHTENLAIFAEFYIRAPGNSMCKLPVAVSC